MYPIIVNSIIEAGWVEVCIVVRVDGRGTNWLFLPSNSNRPHRYEITSRRTNSIVSQFLI